MDNGCDPTFAHVDSLLELLTKSKSLHILLVLDRKGSSMRFSDLKKRVNSSSTTVSRRLKELETYGLVSRFQSPEGANAFEYSLTEDAIKLSPIMQSLFDWTAEMFND